MAFSNTVMEMCHKLPNTNCDDVMNALSLNSGSLPSIIVIQLSELTRIRIFDDIDMKWKSASQATWDFPKKTRDYYWKYYFSVYQNVYYLFVQMLLLKDKCDSLGIEFYVFDGICDINLHCLRDIRDVKGNQEKIKFYSLTIMIWSANSIF